jgi:predicted amidophosphoribosyltransferase
MNTYPSFPVDYEIDTHVHGECDICHRATANADHFCDDCSASWDDHCAAEYAAFVNEWKAA